MGASNLYSSGTVTSTTANATGLPLDGSTVYVRLQSQVNGAFQFVDYTYTAVTAVKAAITSSGSEQRATWHFGDFHLGGGVEVTNYALWFGSTPGTLTSVTLVLLAATGNSYQRPAGDWRERICHHVVAHQRLVAKQCLRVHGIGHACYQSRDDESGSRHHVGGH